MTKSNSKRSRAKRPSPEQPHVWNPRLLGREANLSIFSPSRIAQIIDDTKIASLPDARERLSKSLNDWARVYFAIYTMAKMPSGKPIQKTLKQIDQSASRLLKALGCKLDIDSSSLATVEASQIGAASAVVVHFLIASKQIENQFDDTGTEFPGAEFIRKLHWLRLLAQKAAELDREKRRPFNANAIAIRGLGQIYREIYGREPGVSRNAVDGSPGGPYFRFFRAVFLVLRQEGPLVTLDPKFSDSISQSDEALVALIRSCG